MKSQKLLWSMLLACGLVLQVSCSEMEEVRDDDGRKVTRSEATKVFQTYWDGTNKEVHIQFAREIGTVQVSVLDAKGGIVYGSAIESNVTSHSIILSQLPSGNYIMTLSDSKGSETSLAFSIP